MKYKIELLISTDAPLDRVNWHFAEMLDCTHEVIGEGDKVWDMAVDKVSVQEVS